MTRLTVGGRSRSWGTLAAGACVSLILWAPPSFGRAVRPGHSHPAPARSFTVSVTVTSSDMRHAFALQAALASSPNRRARFPLVKVDARVKFQRFSGLGGAMTDTSAWLLEKQLSPNERDRWMYALFSPQGVGLNFIRVPIGASDFTVGGIPYSYDDLPAGRSDPFLARFSIAHDLAYVIPALREALLVNRHTFVLASPWSPPAWMKANGALNNLFRRGTIIPLYLPSLAVYLVRFVQAYASHGIRIESLTPQNEPSVRANYPGAVLTEPEEASFIHKYLHPGLRRVGLTDVSIYGYDGSWGSYPWSLAAGASARDIAGIAWHCYVNSPDLMRRFHHYSPRLDQMVDECATPPTASTGEILITAFRSWASRVALWNLALDQTGGPVEHPNIACAGCTGIITVNKATHTAQPTLDFFQLAQVGYYVRPGARRIASSTFVTQDVNPPTIHGINDVAFRNPDGQRVLIAYNNARAAKPFTVSDSGRYFSYRLAPGTMATFTWRVG